jgi:hypothetical protein
MPFAALQRPRERIQLQPPFEHAGQGCDPIRAGFVQVECVLFALNSDPPDASALSANQQPGSYIEPIR